VARGQLPSTAREGGGLESRDWGAPEAPPAHPSVGAGRFGQSGPSMCPHRVPQGAFRHVRLRAPRGHPTPRHGHLERGSPGARHALRRLRAPAFPPWSSELAAIGQPPTDQNFAQQELLGLRLPRAPRAADRFTARGQVGVLRAGRPTYHVPWAEGASAALKGFFETSEGGQGRPSTFCFSSEPYHPLLIYPGTHLVPFSARIDFLCGKTFRGGRICMGFSTKWNRCEQVLIRWE
jgi:hypothetical protein